MLSLSKTLLFDINQADSHNFGLLSSLVQNSVMFVKVIESLQIPSLAFLHSFNGKHLSPAGRHAANMSCSSTMLMSTRGSRDRIVRAGLDKFRALPVRCLAIGCLCSVNCKSQVCATSV